MSDQRLTVITDSAEAQCAYHTKQCAEIDAMTTINTKQTDEPDLDATMHREAWSEMVRKCEDDVLRLVATPVGGRNQGENVMNYAHRVSAMLAKALKRLNVAIRELNMGDPP